MRIRNILFRAGITTGFLAVVLAVSIAFAAETGARPMRLLSPAFKDSQPIPVQYTCDGKNISPPLMWSDTPQGTKAYALTVEDPDAPKTNFTHWVVWNMPLGSFALREDVRVQDHVLEGSNDKGGIGYTGPCPPQGVHRYVFTLYALSKAPALPLGATKGAILNAMKGHVLGYAQLTGTYRRPGG